MPILASRRVRAWLRSVAQLFDLDGGGMEKHRDKSWYDAGLARLDGLIGAGDADAALALAAHLAAEAAGDPAEPMGPLTLAGLPRRLHAAQLRLARAQGDLVAKLGWQALQGPALEALLPLARLSADERARAVALAAAPVPRILHQIWIGSLPRPPALAAWGRCCAAHDRDYRLWDETALAGIGATDHPAYRAMLGAGDYPGAVDVARYLVLQAQGGIYLDADFHPAPQGGDFDDYLPAQGLSALAEDTPRITGRGSVLLTNALISCPPGHPVMAALLRILPQAVAQMPRAPAWWVTGPLVFTLLARLCPLGMAAHDIIAGRLPRRAPAEALAQFQDAPGLLIDWKSW